MKISIITCCLNSEKTIRETIESVIKQSCQNIEYLIIDGGSTDNTLNIINEYKNKISKIVSSSDNGIYDAMNKGIKLATGEIIGFLHSDDFYPNNFIIEKVVKAFDIQQVDSVYGDLLYVAQSDAKKIIRTWFSGNYNRNNLKYGWMPPHPTFFVRRRMYDSYGFFNDNLRIAADYDVMMRFLGKYSITTHYISEIVVVMRLGGASNKSLINIIKKMKEDYFAIKKNNIGNFNTLIYKNLRKIPQFFKH